MILYRVSGKREASLNIIPTPLVNPLLPLRVKTYPLTGSFSSVSTHLKNIREEEKVGVILWDCRL